LRSALDSNVVVLLLGNEPSDSLAASDALELLEVLEVPNDARQRGAVVIRGAVYSDPLAHPKMTPATLA
jgi:hypothetical protein